ncbi:MAG TPA: carboxypeptidase-like regulatory domain-containing protein [Terriglobia bacterium]|nr:carboxypeptidase-like regulatory domain-containing protein [Terriglobia bacterium]
MKRAYIVLAAICVICVICGPAWATTVTGTVRDSAGNAVSGAAISFRLINIGRGNVARDSGTSIVAPALVTASSASDGTFSVTLVGNDQIAPAGTLYEVVMRGPGFTYGPFDYSIIGPSADLNSLTPEASYPNTPSQIAASQLSPPAGCSASQVLEWTGTVWQCAASGSGAQHQVNGTNVTANATINFESSAPADGLTLTFANPSAGNVQLGLSGTLNDAGLATAYSGIGACGANQWVFSLTRAGAPSCSPPAFSNLTGQATAAQLPPTINASAIQDKGGQVFNVKAYGAVGNGVFLYNCSITTGTAALTCTAGAFSAGDVGKLIEVDGAAASSGRLLTTISAVTDATHLTLAANAGATTSTANVVYGTDDGPEIQSLITTLSASGGGTMFFPQGIYIINNASDANGFILDIPSNPRPTGPWITYQFEGPNSMAVASITTGVNTSGAVLYGMSAAVTGFIGAASFAPSYPMSDVYVVVRNMAIVTPPTQNYSALHLQLAYNADVYGSVVSPNYGPKATNNVPVYGSTANYGIYLPQQANAGFSGVFDSSIMGYYYGVLGADHAIVSHCLFDENRYGIKVNSRFYTMWLDDVTIQHSTIGLDIVAGNQIFGNVMFEQNTTDIAADNGAVTGTGFLIATDSVALTVSNLSPYLLYVTNGGPLNAPIKFASYTFATLPTEVNGLQVYCSDCKNVGTDAATFDSVAVAGGTGTTVLGENGAWRVH